MRRPRYTGTARGPRGPCRERLHQQGQAREESRHHLGRCGLKALARLVRARPRKAFAPSGPKQLAGLILVTSAGPVACR